MPQIDLDEIIKEQHFGNFVKTIPESFEVKSMRKCMREACRQILAAASERATVRFNDRDDCKQGSPYVDKESITSTIDLLKP